MSRRLVVPAVLALALTTVAVPGQLVQPGAGHPTAASSTADHGEGRAGAGDAPTSRLRLDGPRWRGELLADKAPVVYDMEDHEEVMAAAEAGMGYNVALDKRVNVSAGEVVIQPGRVMIGKTSDPEGLPVLGEDAGTVHLEMCTIGFILHDEKKGYGFSTAGHCVDDGTGVAVPTRVNPSVFMGAGEVTSERDIKTNGTEIGEAVDWAAVDVLGVWDNEGNVNPAAWGYAAPRSGASEPWFSMEAPSDAFGQLVPWPVTLVGQPRPQLQSEAGLGVPPVGVVDRPTQRAGVLVETWKKSYVCECPTFDGDSGAPVIGAFGEAVALVSKGYWRVIGNPPKPHISSLKTTPIDYALNGLPDDIRGRHEIAVVSPMVSLVENTTWSVATIDTTDVVWGTIGCDAQTELCPDVPCMNEPCPSVPGEGACSPTGIDVEACVDELVHLTWPNSGVPISSPEVPNASVPSPDAPVPVPEVPE